MITELIRCCGIAVFIKDEIIYFLFIWCGLDYHMIYYYFIKTMIVDCIKKIKRIEGNQIKEELANSP